MQRTRRGILSAAGALIVGGIGVGSVLGDSHISVELEPFKEEEYVVITNTGNEEIDLSGYYVDFEHHGDDPQLYPLPEGSTVGAGEDFVVATGYSDVPDADYNIGLGSAQLHDTEPDVVALIAPDEETVIESTPFNTTTTTTTTEEEETTTTEEDEEETTTTKEDEETTTTTEEEEDTDSGGDGGSDGEEEPTASVTFEDQDSDGTAVVVQHATLSDGGYVVIHDESGAVLGHSAYLDAGDHSNVEVSLDNSVSSTQTLIAMAHTDDGDQTYGFPGADGPYTADGEPVVDDASITIC